LVSQREGLIGERILAFFIKNQIIVVCPKPYAHAVNISMILDLELKIVFPWGLLFERQMIASLNALNVRQPKTPF
jgi:hypothetical protein